MTDGKIQSTYRDMFVIKAPTWYASYFIQLLLLLYLLSRNLIEIKWSIYESLNKAIIDSENYLDQYWLLVDWAHGKICLEFG